MNSKLLPDHWKNFVATHSLIGNEIEFPWPDEEDLDAGIEILNDDAVEKEATEYWPGIVVLKDGFVPVGGCAFGTGDQFFININDGPNGPLYKIDHEKVGQDEYNRKEAVVTMLDHYEDLLKYRTT